MTLLPPVSTHSRFHELAIYRGDVVAVVSPVANAIAAAIAMVMGMAVAVVSPLFRRCPRFLRAVAVTSPMRRTSPPPAVPPAVAPRQGGC
jgi:hypothetical protein